MKILLSSYKDSSEVEKSNAYSYLQHACNNKQNFCFRLIVTVKILHKTDFYFSRINPSEGSNPRKSGDV